MNAVGENQTWRKCAPLCCSVFFKIFVYKLPHQERTLKGMLLVTVVCTKVARAQSFLVIFRRNYDTDFKIESYLLML